MVMHPMVQSRLCSWWLNQPIWKVLVKMGIWVKIKNVWNHHLVKNHKKNTNPSISAGFFFHAGHHLDCIMQLLPSLIDGHQVLFLKIGANRWVLLGHGGNQWESDFGLGYSEAEYRTWFCYFIIDLFLHLDNHVFHVFQNCWKKGLSFWGVRFFSWSGGVEFRCFF